ncbi:MAG: hypothetical protein A3G81_17580 [Betaproteobacteria bacterium RIFCSPLOWO2_12_FULL_65_14]|nr:MAG: hypothetical protein A3G81_17580 [Betaproteobacteria bacterium RIFCSPLOWO2_12_FULL_65_14]
MVKALDRKLLRDLWGLKTQVVSIALVIACGIGGFIGSLSTHGSLVWSRDNYYDTARFPHVFANAKRAPQSLAERIRAIPGVVEVETRVVRDSQLSIPGVVPPMIARLIGFDFERAPGMNRLTLRSGRWPSPGVRGEVVVNQRFLEARELKLGERPDVLLCDEPTGALDYETGKLVLEVIAKINAELGTTAMVITHNAAISGMADRVLRLGNGRIVGEEKPARKLTPSEISW